MDPLTHSLAGAALSRAGLNRTTPLATVTLVIAANIPDIDVATMAAGGFAPLALRRGWTHGPIGLVVLPVLVMAGMLLYDRYWRRRRRPGSLPARAAPLAALAFIGALTHPVLDWMNTYGVRLFMPFSDRWFYGDALFIIDPWLWLLLAAPLVVYADVRAAVRWAVAGVAATALVVLVPIVPAAAKAVWLAAVLAIVAAWYLRRRSGSHDEAAGGAAARTLTAAAAAYVLIMVGAAVLAQGATERAARAAGVPDHDVMVSPLPANPFAGDIVAAGADAYHLGRFEWFGRPRVTWRAEPLPRGPSAGAVAAAMDVQDVRHYLVWSRYPFVTVWQDGAAQIVWFRDARYAGRDGGGLNGPAVRVAADGSVQLLD